MYGLNISFDYDITKNYRLEHENEAPGTDLCSHGN